MRGFLQLCAAAVLTVAAGVASASADVVYLRNGENIRGAIVRETQSGIIVRVGKRREILIRYEEITEIRRTAKGTAQQPAKPNDSSRAHADSAARDTEREKRVIATYAKKLEQEYLHQHSSTVSRVPLHVRQKECNPVVAAQNYGLPVENAKSSRELEHMFELTLRAYKSGSSPPWVQTLGFFQKTRQEYLDAISTEVELARIYLDNPELPKLLHLHNG